jgi:hypothetical protein
MKDEKTIQKRIQEIEADPRWQSNLKKPANVNINAPLALIQTYQGAQLEALKWVLTPEVADKVPADRRNKLGPGEPVDCPHCGSPDIEDLEVSLGECSCHSCGQTFSVEHTVVWKEMKK